jgi:hypothetical protein
LAEGSLDEIRDRHKENDLEELFFRLISQQVGEPVIANSPSQLLNSGS